MIAVLDTSVVLSSNLPPLSGYLAVSTVTLAELEFGLLRVADPAERARRLRRYSLVQKLFEPLPFDEKAAQGYGELAAVEQRLGRNPRARALDLLVAATAFAHKAQLLTRNVKDFRAAADYVEIVEV